MITIHQLGIIVAIIATVTAVTGTIIMIYRDAERSMEKTRREYNNEIQEQLRHLRINTAVQSARNAERPTIPIKKPLEIQTFSGKRNIELEKE